MSRLTDLIGRAKAKDPRLWQIRLIHRADGGKLTDLELLNASAPQAQTVALDDLVVAAEFRDTSYPGLVSTRMRRLAARVGAAVRPERDQAGQIRGLPRGTGPASDAPPGTIGINHRDTTQCPSPSLISSPGRGASAKGSHPSRALTEPLRFASGFQWKRMR